MALPDPEVIEHDEKHVSITPVECIRNTDKAILVVLSNGDEHWVPQSHVHDDSEVYRRGDQGKLVISKWIARQRKLWIDEEA